MESEQLALATEDQGDIPVYYSESDSETEEPSIKKKRSVGKSWVLVSRYENIQEAEQALYKQKVWSLKKTCNTEEGVKKYYRCNQVKARGPQCASQLYLLFEATSDAVIIYRTDADHDHESISSQRKYGICQETKEEINKLFSLHLKPKAILHSLSQTPGIKVPTMKQLNNYLSDRRRAVYGPSVISLGELEKWLIVHSAIPEDENEPYVIFYYVYECETPIFRFGISTKSLQKLSTVATNIHADATYKIVWQGFPVLVVGTTDKTKKFYPLCLAVSSSERKEDFKMLFEELKKSVYTVYSHVMQPKDLICDAAKSIQNAFIEVFGVETTVKMCWAHAKKNMQKQIVKLVDKRLQKDLLQDIDTLHSVTSPDVFNTALAAFLNKYESQRAFITYFKEEWVIQNPNWYLGASKGSPSTNNALEAFNRSIKDSHTLRERIPLSRFRAVIFDMVKQWSENYRVESFLRTPLIELHDWTVAYQWAKLNKKVKTIVTTAQQKTYLIESSTANNIENGQNWETFDQFKKFAFTHWMVVLPTKNSDWINGECNCAEFFKNYKCKHITGLAIRLKYVVPPVEAKNIPIGQKRKRGRPSKAKRALLVQ